MIQAIIRWSLHNRVLVLLLTVALAATAAVGASKLEFDSTLEGWLLEDDPGLVAYRDKGDAYVTKVSQLTGDLDAVYKDLFALNADPAVDSFQGFLGERLSQHSFDDLKRTVKRLFDLVP